MAVAVFLGAFLGYQLDKLWPIAPWGMVAGIIVGAVAGFWNAYKLAVKNERS